MMTEFLDCNHKGRQVPRYFPWELRLRGEQL
jgi:hypothetical protein